MLMSIEVSTIRSLIDDFFRLMNSFKRLESRPYRFGTDEVLYPVEIHTIDEIGSGRGQSVSELSALFGVTKGAVSQIVSKLQVKGYVDKQRNRENAKEILLSLTDKGKIAFKTHAAMHEAMDRVLIDQLHDFSDKDLALFKKAFSRIESHIERYLAISEETHGE